MPTNYTGDALLVNPLTGGPPQLEQTPFITLPNDGEAAAIGPIVDAFSQVMSEVAWLKRPVPRAAIWEEAMRRYRNYLGHTRFAIDHHGLPAGRIFHISESWLDGAMIQNVGPIFAGAWGGKWKNEISGPTMTVEALGAGDIGPAPCLHLLSTNGTTGTADTYGAREWISRQPNQIITWQTDLQMGVTDIGAVNISFGFGPVGGGTTGFYFLKRSTDTNWHFSTDATGSIVVTDLGVAASSTARRRFRMEVIGANVSDDLNAWIVPYIDGVQLTPISYVNVTGDEFTPTFHLGRASAGTGGPFSCAFGTLDVCTNLWPSDVLT